MEMMQVVGGMDAYCVSMSNAEGPAMKAVREKMLATPWAEEWENKRTMFSYGEEMSTDPLEAMMLKQFVHMGKPKRILEVCNNNDSPLEFTGCLHSYWRCSSSEKCAVQGLKGAKFDTGIGSSFRGDAVEERDSVPFVDAKETQLLYGDAGDAVTLIEDGKRRLRLTKSNVPDWVLWNTGAENGSGIKDLKEGEYKKYVCVEPGFASRPIKVAPGASWIASHEARLL